MKKILGIGNALVDVLIKLPNDELLKTNDLPKGSMQLVDEETSKKVQESTGSLPKEKASGGSAANTIHGLANLGVDCGYIGKIGNDETGEFFKSDLVANKIQPMLFQSETPSGIATTFISPDSERTFATFLGAAGMLTTDDINEDQFKGYDILHIEGYLVYNNPLLEKALVMAKSMGLKVSIDMASFNVVEDNLEFLKKHVKEHVDIVFANEEEASAFTGLGPHASLDLFASQCEVAIVKIGKQGSMAKNATESAQVGISGGGAIDTTGAGDSYAAGFLYGLINDMPLEKCAKIGAIISGHVVDVIGPKLNKERWGKVIEEVQNI